MRFFEVRKSQPGDARSSRRGRRRGLRGGVLGVGLEALEVRVVPTVSTWTGAVSNVWSNPGNWDTLPVAGNDLVFPAGAANLTNTDDLSGVTSFGAITVGGAGYSIAGSTPVSFSGPIDATQATGLATIDLPIALSANTAVTVDNAAATLALGGVISGPNELIKTGPGEADLSAANTYTGATVIDAGPLLVKGTQLSSVSVDAGGTLGGTGSVGAITSVSGTVRPDKTQAGVFTDGGALTLDSGSSFVVALDGPTAGSAYTQISVAGPVSLGDATLSASAGFTPNGNVPFTVIKNTSGSAVTGTFAGLPQAAETTISGQPYQVSYTGGSGHDVVLTHLSASTTAVTTSPAAPVFGQPVTLTATVIGTGSGTPTGTVEFKSGSTDLGPGTLSGGVATLMTSSLPTGASNITAIYSGDSAFATSTSIPVAVTVLPASTSTALTAVPVSSSKGSPVVLTATVSPVSPGAGTPTGTVLFYQGTTELGPGTLSGGVATLTTSSLQLGSDTLTVDYQGDTNFGKSDSPPVLETVLQPSTTTLSANMATAVFGQNVVFTATVTGTGSTPTGVVNFLVGGNSVGSATVVSGVATLSTPALPVGTDAVTATYGGDATFGTSSSSPTTVTVAQAPTSTTLSPSTTTTTVGTSVRLVAAVAITSPGAGTISGDVRFFNGTTSLGTATLSGGAATLATTALPAGSLTLTAEYLGASDFATSTSPGVTVTVTQASTTTVTAAPAASVFGQSVTLTANVSGTAGTVPTGSILFENGTAVLGNPTLVDGVATLTTTALPVGTDAITAVYSGDNNYGTSTSTAVNATVSQANTTTSLTAAPNPSALGQSVTLTATIIPTSPGSGTPTGTVTFDNNGASIGTGTLTNGVATLAVTSLSLGSSSLTAVYGSDVDFLTSTSTAVSESVVTASTTTTLTTSLTNPSAGQLVTLTATVAASSSTVTPGGTVIFTADGIEIGTATPTGGVATLSLTTLPIGAVSVMATYQGDSNTLASTSSAVPVSVGTSLEQYINGIYLDVVGRTPDTAGLEYWVGLLEQGTSARTVVRGIVRSREAVVDQVTNTYESLLGFDPTPAQISRAVNGPNASVVTLSADILGSSGYYKNQGGGTTSGYIDALATDVLGTAPSTAVTTQLTAELNHGVPRVDVAAALLNSTAGKQYRVQTLYQAILNRAAETKGLNFYVGLLNKGQKDGQVEIDLLASYEFYSMFVSA